MMRHSERDKKGLELCAATDLNGKGNLFQSGAEFSSQDCENRTSRTGTKGPPPRLRLLE